MEYLKASGQKVLDSAILAWLFFLQLSRVKNINDQAFRERLFYLLKMG